MQVVAEIYFVILIDAFPSHISFYLTVYSPVFIILLPFTKFCSAFSVHCPRKEICTHLKAPENNRNNLDLGQKCEMWANVSIPEKDPQAGEEEGSQGSFSVIVPILQLVGGGRWVVKGITRKIWGIQEAGQALGGLLCINRELIQRNWEVSQ